MKINPKKVDSHKKTIKECLNSNDKLFCITKKVLSYEWDLFCRDCFCIFGYYHSNINSLSDTGILV